MLVGSGKTTIMNQLLHMNHEFTGQQVADAKPFIIQVYTVCNIQNNNSPNKTYKHQNNLYKSINLQKSKQIKQTNTN